VLGRPHRVTPESLGFIPVPAIGFSVPSGVPCGSRRRWAAPASSPDTGPPAAPPSE
jgi:hypothetical protein